MEAEIEHEITHIAQHPMKKKLCWSNQALSATFGLSPVSNHHCSAPWVWTAGCFITLPISLTALQWCVVSIPEAPHHLRAVVIRLANCAHCKQRCIQCLRKVYMAFHVICLVYSRGVLLLMHVMYGRRVLLNACYVWSVCTSRRQKRKRHGKKHWHTG